jgi:hypothetical protein
MSSPRPDIFKKSLWKPAFEPNMFGSGDLTRVKAERPDISGLEAGHIRETSLEPG